MVPKKNRDLVVTTVYLTLEPFPTGIPSHTFKILHPPTKISKIDFTRVEPDDVPKMAITTPFGLNVFVCMPFDLSTIFPEVLDFCFDYVNDLLVANSFASSSNALPPMASVSTRASVCGVCPPSISWATV
jgi:hypothetical protein